MILLGHLVGHREFRSLKSFGVRSRCLRKYFIKLVGSSKPSSKPISLTLEVVCAKSRLDSSRTLSSIMDLGDLSKTRDVALLSLLAVTPMILA